MFSSSKKNAAGNRRSSSSDRLRGRSHSMDRQSRASEVGKSRSGSAEGNRPSRTARSSLMSAPVQRAPDFRGDKNKNIHELIAFLQEWEIDKVELYTLKALQCPSTKTFLTISKFLIDIIMPGHVVGDKHEEEIPYLFKTLGYPYIINKSAVMSIAPHSWPQLCHALVWLTRCISDIGQVNVELPEFLNYVIGVSQNPDKEAKFEEDMRSCMLAPYLTEETRLQQQLDGHVAKLDELTAEVGNEQELLDGIAKYEKNTQALDVFIKDTQEYLSAKEKQIEEQRLTFQQLTALLAEKRSRREKLEAENEERLEELSPQERQMMLEEQRGAIEKLRKLNTECETISNNMWDSEIKMSQAAKELEEMVRNFNDLVVKHMDPSVAGKLKLMEASVEEQVATVVEPYLIKTQEELLNDVTLQDSYKKREQLAAELTRKKAKLDTLVQQLRKTEDADAASLEFLRQRCKTSEKKLEDVNARLLKLSTEKANLATTEQAMAEEVAAATAGLTQMKEDNEKEEARRVKVLRAEVDEYHKNKAERQEKIQDYILQMEEMVADLAVLKSRWTAVSVQQKIAQLNLK